MAFFWDDENVLKLGGVMVAQLCEPTKFMYWIVHYKCSTVGELYLKKKKGCNKNEIPLFFDT